MDLSCARCYHGLTCEGPLLHADRGATETEKTRVSGSGYVKRTRWRRIDRFGESEFDFWFGTYVDVRKWLRALEHITKHFEQASH